MKWPYPSLADPSRPVALLIALALAGGLGACYTALRHPTTGSPVSVRSDETCYRCHTTGDVADPDLYPWGAYYGESASPWINYYASPWWYDSRWEHLSPGSGGHEETGDSSTSGRRAWGRRPREGVTADTLRWRGSTLPPAPIVSSPPVAPATGGSTPAGQGTTEPQKPKPEKEPKRRALRR